MNGALGHIGVLLGFAAAVVGVVVLAVGLARGRVPAMRERPALRAPRPPGRRLVARGGHGARPPHPRLLPGLRGRQQQPGHAVALLDHRAVVGPGRLDPAVGAGAGRLRHGHGVAVPPPGRRPAGGLGHPGGLRGGRLLLRPDARAGRPVPARGRGRPHQRARAQLAAPGQPPGPHPPAHALPGPGRLHPALRLRHRLAHHRPARRGLAGRDPAVDPVRLGLPVRGHPARAPGGPTRCSGGAGSGGGTRWRTPPSCPGWWAPPTSTR